MSSVIKTSLINVRVFPLSPVKVREMNADPTTGVCAPVTVTTAQLGCGVILILL